MTVKTHPKTKLPAPLARFEAWLRGNERADRTVVVYLYSLQQLATWFEHANGHALTAENLTPSDVKQYRDTLIKQGSKPAGTNRVLAALRAFGEWMAQTQD